MRTRFTWLFWVVTAAALATPFLLLVLFGTPGGGSKASESDVVGDIAFALTLWAPVVIGIIAGARTFAGESRLNQPSLRMRVRSAFWAAFSGTPLLGLLAGAVLGYIADNRPSQDMFPIETGGLVGVFLGAIYGLFGSFIIALIFGTGIGQGQSRRS